MKRGIILCNILDPTSSDIKEIAGRGGKNMKQICLDNPGAHFRKKTLTYSTVYV
jgi:hypothetical protein